MPSTVPTFAPGSRVVIRGEEWLVRRADLGPSGDQVLTVSGLSPLVRNREAKFIDAIEALIEPITPVDPKETKAARDESPYYRDTKLFLEAMLRQSVPPDSRLAVGHTGAMDVLPYQLDPARLALQQPRQRILIADAVGLGKTIECGILLSEMIRRGRGRRILVLTVKSMMTQFQKELWARFSIPLVRLDSVGLQRVRGRIPTNHNPFHYFDKTIISIDTIKQDGEYRHHLEQAWWDVIVIDEAHNIAERSTNSLRSRVAKLLSSRSDSLILLSATPHDGRRESFASIMNMLNPTAIKDPSNYGPDDIEGLFIRRFKKDIKDQVLGHFPERVVKVSRRAASVAEEKAYEFLANLRLNQIDQSRRSGEMLFKTLLEKSLFSSPVACLQTIGSRLKRLAERDNTADFAADVESLERLEALLRAIGPDEFSKYQLLLDMLKGSGPQAIGWKPRDTKDRLVIFTERIPTMEWLAEHLPEDLGLRAGQFAVLHGGMADTEQNALVEAFGSESSSLRLLIASDVAAEGINLHYLSHRMIHFDIPWSLLTFQQRNGRIDRYGQQLQPELYYLLTDSNHEKIRGDQRILEILIEKDKQVQENIGDPSEFTGLHSSEDEERKIAEAIESGEGPKKFEKTFGGAPATDDPFLAALLGKLPSSSGHSTSLADHTEVMPSLFPDDFSWGKAALDFAKARATGAFQADVLENEREIHLHLPSDFLERAKRMPGEIVPADKLWILTSDRAAVINEIAECRKQSDTWPRLQLLWQQHPVMEWMQDKILYAFGRRDAPVVKTNKLPSGQAIVLATGVLPNRKGHALIQRWSGFHFEKGRLKEALNLEQVMDRTGFGRQDLPNPAKEEDFSSLEALVPASVDAMREQMTAARSAFQQEIRPQLESQLKKLEVFRDARMQQLELSLDATPHKRDAEKRKVIGLYDEYVAWIRDTLETEDHPFIRIAAIFTSAD